MALPNPNAWLLNLNKEDRVLIESIRDNLAKIEGVKPTYAAVVRRAAVLLARDVNRKMKKESANG